MQTPNITVKNVKTFQGHDGIGVNADVYVNGVFIGYAHDGAYGGELEFQRHFDDKSRDKVIGLIDLVEAYAKSLPEVDLNADRSFSDKPLMVQPTFESLIDDAINADIAKKEEAKREKKKGRGIMYGVPNAPVYNIITWKKKNLADVPIAVLQATVDNVKKRLTSGQVFLNADTLTSLGVKL
jgi:hypothetical protein